MLRCLLEIYLAANLAYFVTFTAFLTMQMKRTKIAEITQIFSFLVVFLLLTLDYSQNLLKI